MHTPELPGGELGASISASLQHIRLLHEKQQKLEAARIEAEHQVLHRVGSAFRNGEITPQQLIAVFDIYRATDLSGRTNRWNANVDIDWQSMHKLKRRTPNGPEGTWVGEFPFQWGSPAPQSGVPVVYVLYDSANEPCYVGSTDSFRTRMTQHKRDGKSFARWQAYPCRTRDDAYVLEGQLLRERKPYLNRKVGR